MLRRLALAWLIPLILCSCSKPDDQALRETIAEMKQEAEALQWDELRGHISKDYKDDSGYNSFVIGRIIKQYVQGVTGIEATVEIMGISIKGEQAEAQLKLIAKGKKGGRLYYLVGNEDQPEYPRLWFKQEGRHWRLIKVEGIRGPEEGIW